MKPDERGIQISWGQEKRIWIAREIYKFGKVLFLDKATNALDAPKKYSIIETINKLNK